MLCAAVAYAHVSLNTCCFDNSKRPQMTLPLISHACSSDCWLCCEMRARPNIAAFVCPHHLIWFCDRVCAGMAVSGDCSLLVTISRDQSVKVFDVAGFDMVLMLKLKFVPAAAEWIYRVCACRCLPTLPSLTAHWSGSADFLSETTKADILLGSRTSTQAAFVNAKLRPTVHTLHSLSNW